MKKTILLLAFIFTLVSLRVFAQNQIEIYDNLDNVVTGSTINFASSDLNVTSLDVPLKVKNNTSLDITLYARRIINSEVDLSSNAFCFAGTCYSASVDTSSKSALLHPGEINTSFIGDYFPNFHTGSTSITYEFFDTRTTGGPYTGRVTVVYSLDVLGLGDELKPFDITAAYPNPASSSTEIDYNIPAGSNGKILLRNLLGSVVREVILEKQEGKAMISTNELKDGLYFYSVLLDNKIIVTKKLVIRH